LKLSTKSRYGTRLILDMVKHNDGNAIQLSEIAKRQDISVKYLEQIIIPLKKAKYIKGIRGARGGYVLKKAPKDISVGEIVALMEGGETICECTEHPKSCKKSKTCMTRQVWIDASGAMFDKLNSITFADLVNGECGPNL
jgi:Rrf2 family iron-sulfur cluster assembly transcriptional regulator